MSFFTPLNTALGKDVAFVAANLQTERLSMAIRASVHPDLVEEVEVKAKLAKLLRDCAMAAARIAGAICCMS